MNTKKLFIFGVSDYSAVVENYFRLENKYDIGGFVVDDDYKTCDKFCSLKVYSWSEFTHEYSSSEADVFCAVGYKSMRLRQQVFNKIDSSGYQLPFFISSDASVSPDVTIGKSSIIMPNVVLEKGVSIGDNVVVWSNATICHGSSISNGCFIAANVVVGGNVTIGYSCFLGFSSTILQQVRVADETLVGAMSLLNSDSISKAKYCGIPAKKISVHDQYGIEIGS